MEFCAICERHIDWDGHTESAHLRAENERLRAALEHWKTGAPPEMQELYAEAAAPYKARIEAALAAYGRHCKWPDNPRWFEVAEAMVKALKGEKP